jgi:hypothetical protein
LKQEEVRVLQKGVILNMEEKDIIEMQNDLDLHVELYDFLKTRFDCNKPFRNFTVFPHGNIYQFVDLNDNSGYVIRDVGYDGLEETSRELTDIELNLQNQDFITTSPLYAESYGLMGLEFWKDNGGVDK